MTLFAAAYTSHIAFRLVSATRNRRAAKGNCIFSMAAAEDRDIHPSFSVYRARPDHPHLYSRFYPSGSVESLPFDLQYL
jgi:hypothetical protein